MHAVLPELAFGEVECVGQSEQMPSSFLNLLATHAVHSFAFGPVVYPALQEQNALEVLLGGEFEFAGHPKHAVFEFPDDVLYVPASHVPQM